MSEMRASWEIQGPGSRPDIRRQQEASWSNHIKHTTPDWQVTVCDLTPRSWIASLTPLSCRTAGVQCLILGRRLKRLTSESGALTLWKWCHPRCNRGSGRKPQRNWIRCACLDSEPWTLNSKPQRNDQVRFTVNHRSLLHNANSVSSNFQILVEDLGVEGWGFRV